jgi:polyphosphate kinase 2 (PPK2 family)
MLDKIDLAQELKKSELKAVMSDFEPRLISLQRRAIETKIPIIVVFVGWEAAGKASLINRLILSLDPRHFSVHNINGPSDDERLRPFLWRYWVRTPEAGRMAIFDRSWYRRVLMERVGKLVTRKQLKFAYGEINNFERNFTDHGTVIIKLFLHISKEEQKKRFKKLESDSHTAWRVTRDDWLHHKKYDDYESAAEEMFERTNTDHAPWVIVPATNHNFAVAKIFDTTIRAIEDKLEEMAASGGVSRIANGPPVELARVPEVRLASVDLSLSIEREGYSKKLKKFQKRLSDLERAIYEEELPVVLVYEGWDAAGKGGNIKRLTQPLDPRIYDVVPVGAPNDEELKHHYLWRFWRRLPGAGHIAIFDRSWYGRVLVERVEGLCSPNEWKMAYQEINEFEEQLFNFGVIIRKFWFHIDKETQLERFEERKRIPYKRWKITDEDWRNRDKWDAYLEAVEEMLSRTSTAHAPWTIVESNSKLFARLKTIETVIDAIKEGSVKRAGGQK